MTGTHVRRTIALALGLWLSVAQATIEANQASADDLESIKGIGPSTAQRILHQRRTKPFDDWRDLILRVPGIGEKRALRLSEQGLRVQGKLYLHALPHQPRGGKPIGYAPRPDSRP